MTIRKGRGSGRNDPSSGGNGTIMIDLARRPLYFLFMYLPDLSFALVFAAPIFALNVNPALIVANYFEECGIFLDQLETMVLHCLHPEVEIESLWNWD